MFLSFYSPSSLIKHLGTNSFVSIRSVSVTLAVLYCLLSNCSLSLSFAPINLSTLWQQSTVALDLALFRARGCLPSPVVSWLDQPSSPPPYTHTHTPPLSSHWDSQQPADSHGSSFCQVELLLYLETCKPNYPTCPGGGDYPSGCFEMLNFLLKRMGFKKTNIVASTISSRRDKCCLCQIHSKWAGGSNKNSKTVALLSLMPENSSRLPIFHQLDPCSFATPDFRYLFVGNIRSKSNFCSISQLHCTLCCWVT